MVLDVGIEPDRPADEEDEIEVTPEMIEAGLDALASWDFRELGGAELRDAMACAYRAMFSGNKSNRS